MHTRTTRRTLLRSIMAGGVVAGTTPVLAQHTTQQHLPGPLSFAQVAFGQWNLPVDRFAATTPANVGHHVSPHEVTIASGGSVGFLIGGLHLLLVYDDGIQHGDINASLLIPGVPPLVNDPNNRLYRGLDPRTSPVDRIEVVHFHQPGRYLAVCGVLPHFNDQMYGFVRVLNA